MRENADKHWLLECFSVFAEKGRKCFLYNMDGF